MAKILFETFYQKVGIGISVQITKGYWFITQKNGERIHQLLGLLFIPNEEAATVNLIVGPICVYFAKLRVKQ